MSVQAIAVVFVLTVIQLAQGMAIRLKLVESDFLVFGHIGVGVLTFLIIAALVSNLRRQGSRVSSDLSFLMVLFVFQGLAGAFILAKVDIAALAHLVLSFFVVASAATSLVLAASGS